MTGYSHLARKFQRGAWIVMATAMLSCSVPAPDPNRAPLSVTVKADNDFNQLFQRCGPGWTGGDSTYSTALSATQVLWLFSDTFIGPVSREGRRNPDAAQFVQGNSLLLQDQSSGALTTFVRRTVGSEMKTQSLPTYAGSPFDTTHCPADAFVLPAAALAMFQPPQCPSAQHCYYWGGAMATGSDQLYTFLQLMEQTGSGSFDFSWRGSAIATLPLTHMNTAEPTYTKAPNNGVSYGGAVVSGDEKYTYIYGMRVEPAKDGLCSGHCIHVARVPKDRLAQPQEWRYWGSSSSNAQQYDWTINAEHSLPMAGNTGLASAPRTQDQLGVARVARCGALTECYVMIAHQYTGGASEDIVAWHAAQPQGPWAGPVFVYKTPESRQAGRLFSYNAKIHPAFTNADGLLVSYDVNSLAPHSDPLSPLVTADSYRPRFIRVKLHWGTI